MKIDSYKPVGNLVLVKHIYEVGGLTLNTNGKAQGMKIKDRIVLAVGPDVTRVTIGDYIQTDPNSYSAVPVFFADNDKDIVLVADKVKDAIKSFNKSGATYLNLDPNKTAAEMAIHNPSLQMYEVVEYFNICESDIKAIVNPSSEDPIVPKKSSLILPN